MAKTKAQVRLQNQNVPRNPTASKKYTASLFYGKQSLLPDDFCDLALQLEKKLGMPIWFLIQAGETDFDTIGWPLKNLLVKEQASLPVNVDVGLVIDSLGGSPEIAYQLASLFRRRCGNFTAIIPRYAKSAATLMVLGANSIILGRHAELGPLDAQILDEEREIYSSALDEVHSLERLQAFAMDSIDKLTSLLMYRTGKKTDVILPLVLKFVSDMMRPLFERIDVVHYTRVSRVLKVAEEYAVRLLVPHYTQQQAEEIARKLVEHYPHHIFTIDAEEARKIGLNVEQVASDINEILDGIYLHLDGLTLVGGLKEVSNE